MAAKLDKNSEAVVTLIVELYNILKSMGVPDHTGEWLQFLHWDRIMNIEQKRARLVMDRIIQVITQHNDQISPRVIYDRVIYSLLQLAIWYPKDYPNFSLAAKNEVQILLEYKASRNIDVPLIYLVAENPPVKFGKITIYNITEEDRRHSWWEKILTSGGANYSVLAYARVASLGDLERSLENAKTIVNDMMTFLRAIGFPITAKSQNQFGVLNEYAASLVPYRRGTPAENHKLEFPVQVSTTVSALHTYELQKEILGKITPTVLAQLNKLIDDDYPKPSTDLKRKFFLGLRWLGEATRPDTINARFVKLSLSLEGLIGGETGDSRNTKIILAKRCAILMEKNFADQKKLYHIILRNYILRSKIIHGVDKSLTEKDFSSFGECVRRLAWSLLEKIEDFKTINELHNWVSTQPSWSLL